MNSTNFNLINNGTMRAVNGAVGAFANFEITNGKFVRAVGDRNSYYGWTDGHQATHKVITGLSTNFIDFAYADIDSSGNLGPSKGGVGISAKQLLTSDNIHASEGGGLNLDNSDIINIGSMYMHKAATNDLSGHQWARGGTPPGSALPAQYDTFRVLDGVAYLNGVALGTSNIKHIWSGVNLMGEGTIVTPSRTLTSAPNGWILIFSRYVNGASANSDWNTMVVPVFMRTLGGGQYVHGVAANSSFSDPPQFKKYLYFNGTDVRGHVGNTTGTANGQCLRYIIEF